LPLFQRIFAVPIEAVIFDMDGVLVDSEVYWQKARVEFARDLGKQWDTHAKERVMGRNTIEWAEAMREYLNIDMPREEVIEDVIRRVMALYDAHLPTRPGAIEAVHMAAKHFRVALASASPTRVIDYVMRLTGLDKVFEVMVYGDDLARGKPAPDIYLEAARQLGVEPRHCVGVEDSANGIRALKAAGMYVIAAPSPEFPLSLEVVQLADQLVASLEDITLDMLRSFDR
jgi:HAD superfamily hydrolase (TIGR01509 family)